MADPLTVATVAKLGVEAKALALKAGEGMKTAVLDALRTRLTGGEALGGLAKSSGWSLSDLHQHADKVLRVAGSDTKHVETTLTPSQCREVHAEAGKLDVASQQGERLGLEATKTYLKENGFTCIKEFGGGGPDGAMPDIVCRGPDGRPWVVEVKGTQAGTALKDMGLDRGPDGAGGTRWENGADWLRSGGEHTLEEMDKMLAEHPDPELQALRDDYAELVDNGFDDPNAYGRAVIHAGDNLPMLDSSNLQGKVADYVRDVQPDLVAQVHTDNYDV